jgi:hypothetical protein
MSKISLPFDLIFIWLGNTAGALMEIPGGKENFNGSH